MANPSNRSILKKLKTIRGIQKLIKHAILLYVLMLDGDCPAWAKAVAVAALAYLIDPIDAIPDITPLIGYIDDLGIILAAIKTLSSQIKSHHHNQTKEVFESL